MENNINLFLCSHFLEVGEILKDEVFKKRVAFISTASKNEDYKGYVLEALNLFKEMKAEVLELDISTESIDEIVRIFEKSDLIYFSGGNTFFLIDCIRKKGIDNLLKQYLNEGKMYIGESAGAIILASDISYIEKMDEVPKDYSQKDNLGLGLIDFFVVPHYKSEPFTEVADIIVNDYKDIDLVPITNAEAIKVENGIKNIISMKK